MWAKLVNHITILYTASMYYSKLTNIQQLLANLQQLQLLLTYKLTKIGFSLLTNNPLTNIIIYQLLVNPNKQYLWQKFFLNNSPNIITT